MPVQTGEGILRQLSSYWQLIGAEKGSLWRGGELEGRGRLPISPMDGFTPMGAALTGLRGSSNSSNNNNSNRGQSQEGG